MDVEEEIEIMAEDEEVSSNFSIVYIFEHYGWYLLIVGVLLSVIYSKFHPKIMAYQRKKKEEEYAARYHKDPDVIANKLAAQEEYARKLQEKYNIAAQEHKKKMEEKEAKKREEWLQRHSEGGNSLGRSTFKSDYNPLMGDSSRGYKATKKSPCGGGGCGK